MLTVCCKVVATGRQVFWDEVSVGLTDVKGLPVQYVPQLVLLHMRTDVQSTCQKHHLTACSMHMQVLCTGVKHQCINVHQMFNSAHHITATLRMWRRGQHVQRSLLGMLLRTPSGCQGALFVCFLDSKGVRLRPVHHVVLQTLLLPMPVGSGRGEGSVLRGAGGQRERERDPS